MKRRGANASKPVMIYGIFDRAGVCLYVGQSVKPRRRFADHISLRFQKEECELRVLRKCQPDKADRVEVEVMTAFRKKGQALMNRVLRVSGRPRGAAGTGATDHIQARISPARKRAYMRAAKLAKLSLAEWILQKCDAEASEFLGE